MQLTKKHIQFITNNRHILEEIFKVRVTELTELAMRMPQGEDRDVAIRFVQEFERWTADMKKFEQTLDIPEHDPHI